MEIIITPHARARMIVYGITEEQMLAAIRTPERTVSGRGPRIVAEKRLNGKLVRVVYEIREQAVIVVTAYPASPERYGHDI